MATSTDGRAAVYLGNRQSIRLADSASSGLTAAAPPRAAPHRISIAQPPAWVSITSGVGSSVRRSV